MAEIKELHGVHAWNCATRDYRRSPFSEAPDGEAAAWHDLACQAGAGAVKFLWPDHGRTEAETAKRLGLRVLFRAPGEGEVHYEEVSKMITALAGVCDIIEVGNEPATDPGALWRHAQYLEWVALYCAAAAAKAGITLCTPGWRNGLGLPVAGDVDLPLANRLRTVYSRFEMHAIHVYDVHRLVATWRQPNAQRPPGAPIDAIDHINSWFGDLHQVDVTQGRSDHKRRYVVTEYGIAARLLAGFDDKSASDLEKAGRYYQFLAALALYTPFVEGAYMFILGGTTGFERFDDSGQYKADGHSSYWLEAGALAALGQHVRF
jgi:hypothetical protein